MNQPAGRILLIAIAPLTMSPHLLHRWLTLLAPVFSPFYSTPQPSHLSSSAAITSLVLYTSFHSVALLPALEHVLKV